MLSGLRILGQDFQRQHLFVKFKFGGPSPELTLNSDGTFSALIVPAIENEYLFPNLSHNYKPISTKSRRLSSDDQKLI